MAKIEKITERDQYPLQKNRTYGRKLFVTDMDCLAWNYENDEIILKFCMDYKKCDAQRRGSITLEPSILAQIKAATKMEIPFFLCLTFLGDAENPNITPMYYIIPYNKFALQFFYDKSWHTDGKYLTERKFVEWQHEIRGLDFAAEEKHPDNDFSKLSTTFVAYSLPHIERKY